MKVRNWIIATTLVLIAIGGGLTLIIEPERFEISLTGNTVAEYEKGELKIYNGRFVALVSNIRLYHWDGLGHRRMYKAWGDKYSNISYSESCNNIPFESCDLKQTIRYSQGNLTYYATITKFDIKESVSFKANEPDKRFYMKWYYEDLDRINDSIVYLNSSKEETLAELDFDIKVDWSNELENIVRVQRYKNGNFMMRTRVYEGEMFFDPTIIIHPTEFYGVNVSSFNMTNEDNLFWHISINTGELS